MAMEAYRSGIMLHPNRSLAGKFFTDLLPPSLDRTESTLRQQWKLSGRLKVFPLEKDNIIIFEFKKKRDKKKVLNNGPWNVDGFILVLKECSQDISMTDIDFSVACFWVKVLGLPFCDYTDEGAERVGKKLSDKPLIEVKRKFFKRKFWVKAEINLKNPIPPGFYNCIGIRHRRVFVQFKYENLGDFCENCGMVSHRKCENAAKLRRLTRKLKTHVYGPWLRYDPEPARIGLPIKLNNIKLCDDIGLGYEDTLTYSQFKVSVKVNVVNESEHEWLGKKLIRSLFKSEFDIVFRLPCYPTQVTKDVLACEVDKISPLTRLTVEDKDNIVRGIVDYLKKQRKVWSKKRWVPISVRVNKTIMVSPVDMETMVQEDKVDKLLDTIDTKIMEKVKGFINKSDDILIMNIRDIIREVDLSYQIPASYTEMMYELVKDMKYFASRVSIKLHPDHNCVTVFGPDMDLFGTCCICQGDFFLGEKATLTSPCSHVFHTHCIQHWIQKSQECPLCRLKLQVMP